MEFFDVKIRKTVYRIKPIRRKRKSMQIEIEPDGKIKVVAPIGMPICLVKSFVESKVGWVEKTMNKLDQMDWIRLDDFKNSPCESLESVEDRMKAKAESVLKERLCLYGKSMGIQPNKVIVKSQKKRWGSCSSSGIIRLNWKCVLLKPEVMDYIIVHELCHLREMNHSKLFWKEVEKILPDYKDRQDQLKKIKFEC